MAARVEKGHTWYRSPCSTKSSWLTNHMLYFSLHIHGETTSARPLPTRKSRFNALKRRTTSYLCYRRRQLQTNAGTEEPWMLILNFSWKCRSLLCVVERGLKVFTHSVEMPNYSKLPDHGQVSIYMDDNERKGIHSFLLLICSHSFPKKCL